MSEHLEQAALIEWTEYKGHPYNLIFAIPNGGFRNKRTAAILKKEGVKAGVPDLFLPVAASGFNGLFIEMKYGRNNPTDNQNKKMQEFRTQGYACQVCWSWHEARQTIDHYLNR